MSAVGLEPCKELSSPQHTGMFASPTRQIILIALLLVLVLATVAVYYPVHNHPFSNYDDDTYVVDNTSIHDGLNWQSLKWATTTYYAANWHPLTWMSHALDCQLFQADPAGAHDHNLALHALNSVLLFLVLLRATGYIGRSAMVAGLFALHPLNVETVAWISERKNLLSMLFFLLALGAYRWYARQPRVGRYALVALLYWFGLMAKPQVITFPCILLLWDYWPLGRMFSGVPGASNGVRTTQAIPPKSLAWLLIEKLPLMALSALDAVLTMKAQFGSHAENWFPKPVRVGNAILSYALYLEKTVWPTKLALFYPHPGTGISWARVAVAFVVLLSITLLVILQWRQRYLTVGWLWFAGTLVPMIGIVQVGEQAMADRYAYLPLVGVFLMFVWGVAGLVAWATRNQPESRRRAGTVLAGTGIAALLALSVMTRLQVDYWNDNFTVWTHALQVTEGNWVAEDLVGAALLKSGKMEAAMPHYYKALAYSPNDLASNLNIGAYLEVKGNFPEAIEHFNKVLAHKIMATPVQLIKTYTDLGYTYQSMGDYVQARENLKVAVQLKPTDAKAWTNLGVVAQKTGDLDLATSAYSKAIQLQPLSWRYLLLSRALEQAGHHEQAQVALEKAKKIALNFDDSEKLAAEAFGPVS